MPYQQVRIIFFLLITFLCSCHSVDILKRKYNNGFYINLIDKKSSYCENIPKVVIKKNNTFKETNSNYSEKISMTKNVSEIFPGSPNLMAIDSTAAEKNNKIKLDYNFISVPPDTTDKGQQNYFNEVFDSLPDNGLLSLLTGIIGLFLVFWPFLSIYFSIVGFLLGIRKLKKNKLKVKKKREEVEKDLLEGKVGDDLFVKNKFDLKAVLGIILSIIVFLLSVFFFYYYAYIILFW